MRMIRSVVTILLVAAVWGYFADFRSGQIGWFIGRLAFCAAVAVVFSYLFRRVPSKRSMVAAGEAA